MSKASAQAGKALRTEIARRGLSQEEVANRFNVTQSRVSRVLKGEFSQRSELARALCDAYLEGLDPIDPENYAHIEMAGQAFERAIQALRLMWDGSTEHAERLTKMINAVHHSRNVDQRIDASVQGATSSASTR